MVSLRLGHARGLTTHRVVIQDPRAASLVLVVRYGGSKPPHYEKPDNYFDKLGFIGMFIITNSFRFSHGYKLIATLNRRGGACSSRLRTITKPLWLKKKQML